MSARSPRLLALALVPVLALAACTPSDGPEDEETASEPATVTESPTATGPEVRQGEVNEPAEASTVLAGASPAAVATSTSESLFASAPVVVLAGEEDLVGQLRGASAAVALGAPLLLTGDDAGLTAEMGRLGTEWVLAVGAAELPAGVAPDDGGGPELVRAPQSDDALAEMLGMSAGEVTSADTGTEVTHVAALEPGSFTPLTPGAAGSESASPDGETGTLPPTEPAEPLAGVAVLSTGEAGQVAAVATARAAGAQVEVVPGGDPRATSESVQAIAALQAEHVVALGDAFGDAQTVAWRSATAATGVELPGGGQLVFPGRRYVALYGTPSTTALGVLGEQDVPATVQRATEQAAPYVQLTQDTVVPAMEIIATVASAQAGSDGNYSNELAVEDLRPLVEAAGEAGQYVVSISSPAGRPSSSRPSSTRTSSRSRTSGSRSTPSGTSDRTRSTWSGSAR